LASTSSISDPTNTRAAVGRRTLLFRVGATVYGCDIEDIREIVPFRRATRLPGAPSYIQGLINLRGTIVTVVDLVARLEPGRPPVTDGSIMLVGIGGSARMVGIAVQEVMDVRLMGGDGKEDADDGAPRGYGGGDGGGSSDGIVRGLGRIDDTVVILLDIHQLLKQVLLS
jgi:purine-binding chemotaxis protein CheW